MILKLIPAVTIALAAVISTHFVGGISQLQGQGCSAPPCFPNTVPCAHCTGLWTDGPGGTWNLSSNNNPPTQSVYAVSGTAESAPIPGCQKRTYTVTGTITHNIPFAQLNVTASNPTPPPATCGGGIHPTTVQVTATLPNNSCNTLSGTWVNTFPGGATGSGSFSATKPADLPDLSPPESSTPRAWSSQYGGTVMQYQGDINATKSFAGRQVFEASGGTATDGCWFPASNYGPAQLTGGGWYVGHYIYGNQWNDDYVGYTGPQVQYYRLFMRTPCQAVVPQQMRMYKNGTSASDPYSSGDLIYNLPDNTWVGTARNGVQAWRTYP